MNFVDLFILLSTQSLKSITFFLDRVQLITNRRHLFLAGFACVVKVTVKSLNLLVLLRTQSLRSTGLFPGCRQFIFKSGQRLITRQDLLVIRSLNIFKFAFGSSDNFLPIIYDLVDPNYFLFQSFDFGVQTRQSEINLVDLLFFRPVHVIQFLEVDESVLRSLRTVYEAAQSLLSNKVAYR